MRSAHMHVNALLMPSNAFLSEREFVLVRGCAAPPSSPPLAHPSPSTLSDRREMEARERITFHRVNSAQVI